MLPDGRIALTRKADGTLTYELTPRHELPEEAEMVTPGGVVGR